MKRLIPILSILAVVTMACSVTVNMTPTSAPVGNNPVVEPPTEQPPIVEPPATVFVEPTSIPANVTCNKLSLYLDPVLGSGYDCATIPESSGGQDMPYFAINPEYTEVTFQNYALSGTFFEAHIDVFPVQRYSQLIPDFISQQVAELQGLIAGGTPGGDGLPLLPAMGAAQIFYSQAAVIQFRSGSGIRYLTEYAQYTAPINNQELFYTFQGLTSDGQYWISAILPISNPILPADGTNPPGGQSWESFGNNYEPYITNITSQLNAQPPGSFAPNLAMLDVLVNSIMIQP